MLDHPSAVGLVEDMVVVDLVLVVDMGLVLDLVLEVDMVLVVVLELVVGLVDMELDLALLVSHQLLLIKAFSCHSNWILTQAYKE